MAGFTRIDEPLPPIPEGPVGFNRKFFEELVNRIETIRPKQREGGVGKGGQNEAPIITVKPSKGYGLIVDADLTIYTFLGCENGVPKEFKVYGPRKQD